MSCSNGVTCRSQSSIFLESTPNQRNPNRKSQLNLHSRGLLVATDNLWRVASQHFAPNGAHFLFESGGKSRQRLRLSLRWTSGKKRQRPITCRRSGHERHALGKVGVNSASVVSVARRGFPAARRRDRNRSVRRLARPHALAAALPLALTPPAYPRPSLATRRRTPTMGGRDFPPTDCPQHGRRYLRRRPLTTV